jgi:PBP1b-binding outer membrane lipoprotein LpoB
MKKWVALILTSVLLLTGCESQHQRNQEVNKAIDEAVKKGKPQKINLIVEMGTWGNKMIIQLENVQWETNSITGK